MEFPPNGDLESALKDIAVELGLGSDAHAVLRETVIAAQIRLHKYYAIRDNYAAMGGRQGVIAFCDKFLKILKAAEKHLSSVNPLSNGVLKTWYPKILATLLDHRAFERYLHADLTLSLDHEFDCGRVRLDRGEAFDLAIDELTGRKHRAAELKAQVLLLGVVRELAEPLTSYRDIERRQRGGRPRSAERDFVIQEMAEIFHRLTGKAPTASPSGQFVTLCDRILEVLGISAEGIETAVQRRLRARRRSRRPASS